MSTEMLADQEFSPLVLTGIPELLEQVRLRFGSQLVAISDLHAETPGETLANCQVLYYRYGSPFPDRPYVIHSAVLRNNKLVLQSGTYDLNLEQGLAHHRMSKIVHTSR